MLIIVILNKENKKELKSTEDTQNLNTILQYPKVIDFS
jgi:hypothetical protein